MNNKKEENNNNTLDSSKNVTMTGFCDHCEKGVQGQLVFSSYSWGEGNSKIIHKLRCPDCAGEVYVEVEK